MRYFFHPESETYWTEESDSDALTRDGHATELDREEYLEGLATQALWNVLLNGGSVPDDAVDCAAEMIEQGVFGPSEECVDEYGLPLAEYVIAVGSAKRGWVNR